MEPPKAAKPAEAKGEEAGSADGEVCGRSEAKAATKTGGAPGRSDRSAGANQTGQTKTQAPRALGTRGRTPGADKDNIRPRDP